MRKWLIGFLLLLSLLLFLFLGGIYFFGGLKEYIKAVYSINQLKGNQKDKAAQIFYEPNQYGVHTGILSKVFKDRVWIIGKNGLKSFKIDEYSAYTLFSVCNEETLRKIKEGEDFTIGAQEDVGLEYWASQVKTGDFVQILVAGPQHGGTIGNLREIKAYDWWVFTPVDIIKQCEK